MRTAAITLTLVLTISGAQAIEPPQADFYVATTGDDANDGSRDRPFATPVRAQRAVRSLIAAGLNRNVTVLLRGGEYMLGEPLRFGPEDSATERYSITYAASPGEQVVLSGGRVLSGWKKGVGNRWTLFLPEVQAGRWWFRQLFADGERLPRARFPNRGSLLTVESVSADVQTIGFREPLAQADLNDGSAELVMVQNWSISRALIKSSTDDAVTTMTPIGWIGHGPATTASPGKPAYLEHAEGFLDQPREWFLDRKRGLLSYLAVPGEDPNAGRFIAPALPLLVQVDGRSAAPVRRIVFRGLTFAHSAWPLPVVGYSGIQAGHYGAKMGARTYVLPPALRFTYAEGCRLERCRVAHTGATGIGFGAGCRRSVVSGCDLLDIGGNGVMVGWRGGIADSPLDCQQGDPSLAADWRRPEQVPVGNEVSNNTIRRCGAVNHGCVGIFAAFCAETNIAHNLVADMPYTGISIGFRWDES
ncbi:MAG: hypothetical protein ACC645_01825, partial [Pirellulales bacterium]